MRACPSCGHENADNVDFCGNCGEYVRWEPTGYMSAVNPAVTEDSVLNHPAEAPAQPAAPAQPDAPAAVPAQAAAPAPAQPAAAPAQPAAPAPEPVAAPTATAPPPTTAPVQPAAPAPEPVTAEAPAAAATAEAPAEPPPAEEDDFDPIMAPSRPQLDPDQIMLTLRAEGQESATGEPVVAEVDAGGRTTVYAFVRNQSGIVDNYDLRVEGMPEAWWSVFPGTVYLVPYGTAGQYEQEVQVVFHPPRAAESVARPWSFHVVVTSKAQNADASSPPGTLTIHPYTEIDSELTPPRSSGRRKAKFDIAIVNKANAPVPINLIAIDDAGECDIQCPAPEVTIEPGETVTMPMVVRAPKRIIVGRPFDRRLEVTPTPADTTLPPITRYATFRQKPMLPWWIAPIVPLLIIAAILAYLLWPKNETVPDLTKVKGTLAAQKLLDKSHLKMNPQIVQKVMAKDAPGTIFDQTPAAGKKVKKNSQVTIAIALAPGGGAKLVPDLAGVQPSVADGKLRKAGLSLGAIAPTPDPSGTILSQIPVKGTKVKPGTPVNVFLAPAGKAAAKGKNAAKKGGAAGAAATAAAAAAAAKAAGATGAPVIVANVASQAMQKGATTLSQEGLIPKPQNEFAAVAPGTVVGTDPVAGTKTKKGTPVTVLISVGYPRLAYDDGGQTPNVLMSDGGTGKKLPVVTKGTSGFSDPTWSPDGKTLVFRSSTGQLFSVDTTSKDAVPAAITPASVNLHDPTFAPSPKGDLLAAVKQNAQGTDGDLCFLRLKGSSAVTPNCIADPAWNVGRRIAWSPDGTQVLVYGASTAAPTNSQGLPNFGLIQYTSKIPFSADPSQWGQGKPVTDVSTPGKGVIDAAFSPDGKQIALLANTDNNNGDFNIYLIKPGDFFMAKAQKLPLTACDVSWRPDGGELLYEVGQAGCPATGYAIARVDPTNPKQTSTLVPQGAENPAWQPVTVATAPPLPVQAPASSGP